MCIRDRVKDRNVAKPKPVKIRKAVYLSLIHILEMLDENGRPHTLDQIGIERIIRAAKKIKEEFPDTKVDLGFRHFILAEPEQNTLDKLEKFDPTENKLFADKDILSDFGKPTVLSTWLVRDGYGLTADAEELNFGGYNGYYIGKHLYLIDPESVSYTHL